MSASPFAHLFSEDLYDIPPSVIVVLSRPWDKYTDHEKTLLSKILGSVKLDVTKVRIIHREHTSATDLASLGAEKILLFGVEAVDVKTYENQQAQGFSVIRADDLSILDDARKKSLWLALRSMFGI